MTEDASMYDINEQTESQLNDEPKETFNSQPEAKKKEIKIQSLSDDNSCIHLIFW